MSYKNKDPWVPVSFNKQNTVGSMSFDMDLQGSLPNDFLHQLKKKEGAGGPTVG